MHDPSNAARIDTRIDEGIAHITYQRAGRANSLSTQGSEALREALRGTTGRCDVHLVVLRSEGDRAFCAGADVTEMRDLDAVAAERFIRGLHLTFREIRNHSAPVICAVQGACLGAGLEMMISCDATIASRDAVFGMPEPFVGMPSVIEAALLPTVIGLMRTRDLLLTGDNVTADEAHAMGMLTEVCQPANLEARVEAKAAQLLRHPADALSLQKQLMNRWLNLPMDEAVEAGIQAFALAVGSGTPKRAIASYWAERTGDDG